MWLEDFDNRMMWFVRRINMRKLHHKNVIYALPDIMYKVTRRFTLSENGTLYLDCGEWIFFFQRIKEKKK